MQYIAECWSKCLLDKDMLKMVTLPQQIAWQH